MNSVLVQPIDGAMCTHILAVLEGSQPASIVIDLSPDRILLNNTIQANK
jgi:hypothetical protein